MFRMKLRISHSEAESVRRLVKTMAGMWSFPGGLRPEKVQRSEPRTQGVLKFMQHNGLEHSFILLLRRSIL